MSSSAIKAIFTKTFVAISLINMLGLAGYYAIFVVSTQFLSEVFHASTAVAGLATGIIVIGCLVGRFFTGSIVHSAGYRRVLFCGVVLYLLTNAAYFFADTLALIFLVRFVSGVAVGIVGTVTGTIVAVVVPSQFHGRGIAYFSMSTALALCFGPFIGIALVDTLGYEGIFAIGTAMRASTCCSFHSSKSRPNAGLTITNSRLPTLLNPSSFHSVFSSVSCVWPGATFKRLWQPMRGLLMSLRPPLLSSWSTPSQYFFLVRFQEKSTMLTEHRSSSTLLLFC